MKKRRVLVCGGRHFSDRDALFIVLDAHLRTTALVIHGGARGADFLAGEWAKERGVPVKVYKADWRRHRYAAGPIRNKQMLREGRPDVVIAFPGGNGTANMIAQAQAALIPVITVTP
jgi:hypothetical protein